MSILREVIESVEEIEWSTLNERFPILTREVHLCKSEIFKILDDFYIQFTLKPVKIPHVADKLLGIQKELEDLHLKCKQGMTRECLSPKKTKDYKTILEQLEVTIHVCSEVNSCYCINEKFVDLRLYENDCQKSMQILEDIRNTVNNTESEILIKYFRRHFKMMESATHIRLSEVIASKFIFEVKEHNSVSYIEVRKNINISDSIHLLLKYSNYIKLLDDLKDFMWEFIIVPIVTCDIVMTSDDTKMKLVIKRNEKPHYKDVLDRLQTLTTFLNSNFDICIDETLNKSLLDYIGNQLENRLSSLIITHCFQNIRGSSSEPKSLDYMSIVKQVETLQTGLERVKLVTDDSLVMYAKDLQQIHFSRTHEPLLDQIKVSIKSNYDIVRVGSQTDKNKGDSSYNLPSMSISSVMQEIEQLSEAFLMKAAENDKVIDIILNLIHYYRIYASKDVKQKTSQEIALLYNNHIYMACILRQWNIYYGDLIPKVKNVPLFKDESLIFQTVGEEILETFLLKEKNRLAGRLHKLVEGDVEVSCKAFEITFKNCLEEVELLIVSWYDLLSLMVFHKSIGGCLNVLCHFLIKFVLKFESIDDNFIGSISRIFDDILKIHQQYFEEVVDLKKFITCWDQFRALSLIFKSDLVEIETNEYHKIFKSNFKPFEVKRIFKSLFKQSERRTIILSQLYT